MVKLALMGQEACPWSFSSVGMSAGAARMSAWPQATEIAGYFLGAAGAAPSAGRMVADLMLSSLGKLLSR